MNLVNPVRVEGNRGVSSIGFVMDVSRIFFPSCLILIEAFRRPVSAE